MRAGALLLALISCSAAPAQETYTLSGRVTGAGQPQAGVKVDYTITELVGGARREITVHTDSAGRFSARMAPSSCNLFFAPAPALGFLGERIFNIDVNRDIDIAVPLIKPVTISGLAERAGGAKVRARFEVWSLTTSDRTFVTDVADQFRLEVPPDLYAIHAIPEDPALAPSRTNVDARTRSVHNIELTIESTERPYISGTPPRADRNEPFAPVFSGSNGNLPVAPEIPFRYPSGSLRARVIAPDGTVTDLGDAPFTHSKSQTPVSRRGLQISGSRSSTAHMSDIYQLSTADDRFRFTFRQSGRHQIVLAGRLADIWGNEYEGQGTFDVEVARPLTLRTAVLPGTPFTERLASDLGRHRPSGRRGGGDADQRRPRIRSRRRARAGKPVRTLLGGLPSSLGLAR